MMMRGPTECAGQSQYRDEWEAGRAENSIDPGMLLLSGRSSERGGEQCLRSGFRQDMRRGPNQVTAGPDDRQDQRCQQQYQPSIAIADSSEVEIR
jgi:hypothetical protein